MVCKELKFQSLCLLTAKKSLGTDLQRQGLGPNAYPSFSLTEKGFEKVKKSKAQHQNQNIECNSSIGLGKTFLYLSVL